MMEQNRPKLQIAALPYRAGPNGAVEVLLVTSRETKRWVIPKGWPIKGKKPHRAAEQEAYEEAGVVGVVEKEQVGCYGYVKRLDDGSTISCEVAVFALRVEVQHKQWPEMKEREVRWFTPEHAAQLVVEDGLSRIFANFGLAMPVQHAALQQRLRLRKLWKPTRD